MAQLKDLLVTGQSRLIGDAAINSAQIDTLAARTSSGSTSYGPGTNGQVLYSNATQAYWGSLPALPQASSLTPKMDGTAAVGTSATFARADHVHPTDTSRAASSHTHGNITSGGDITTTVTIASGDRLVINDESESKINNSSITFGTSTSSFLANNGTWQSAPPIIPYAQVDSASTSTVFTATVSGVTSYYDGLSIFLKNGRVTSASGFTINVNGLGAKPVYNNMAAATADTTIFNINYTMLFVYDSTRVSGGAWICYRGYDSNSDAVGYQLRTNNTTLKASDTARYYKIYFTSADGTHFVPASADSTNNATAARAVNQRPIDPFGRIVYFSGSGSVAAEATLSAGSIWSQYNLTFGYSFNRTGAALTLTSNTPVFIKCAPQTNGSAIIDATTPYVQTLPTTDDGKIYIFLGIATSATAVELYQVHPVYYYKGGAIRLWTNQLISSIYYDYTDEQINGNVVITEGVALSSDDLSFITSISAATISSILNGTYA